MTNNILDEEIINSLGNMTESEKVKLVKLIGGFNHGNRSNKNTTFLIIQQVTKAGTFAGSNRFKHMLTGMARMQFVEGGRYISFSKNRRGGQMDKLFFSLDQKENVGWLHTEAMNAPIQ